MFHHRQINIVKEQPKDANGNLITCGVAGEYTGENTECIIHEF